MKVKISSWKDLRVGDVWCNMVIEGINGSLESCKMCAIGYAWSDKLSYRAIEALIAAGNDEVERKEDKVVRICDSGCHVSFFDPPSGRYLGYGQVNVPYPCKVTIEPL